MKGSILVIILIISVGLVFSVIGASGASLLIQFLAAFGLFVVFGLIALFTLTKKNKKKP